MALGLTIGVAPACSVTPIDAVTELEGGVSSTGGSSATGGLSGTGGNTAGLPDTLDVSICPATFVPVPGDRYLIMSRSAGACLTAGEMTRIDGAFSPDATGFEVYAAGDCTGSLEQRWRLDPQLNETPTGDVWYVEVRNQALQLNLDMEAADVSNGTRALLYDPHDMENQRFQFIREAADYYSIQPTHVDNFCLQRMDTGEVQMHGCEGGFAGFVDQEALLAQQWQLASEDCVE